MATLRGGAGRSDSVADMHVNERPKRQRRNIDYKRLHNGQSLLQQVEHPKTQQSGRDKTRKRPRKLQRTRPPLSSTKKPSTARPAVVPKDPLSASLKYTTSITVLSNEHTSRSQSPPDPTGETSEPSQLESGDDLSLHGIEDRIKQWTNPANITRYGASEEWVTNIGKAFQPASAQVHRHQRIRAALSRGSVTRSRARRLERGTYGLRFQSSSKKTLSSEDSEAAEVLRSSMTDSKSRSGND